MADIDDIYNLLAKSLPDLKNEIEIVRSQLSEVKTLAVSNQRSLRGTETEPGLVHRVNTLCTGQAQLSEMVQDHDRIIYKGNGEDEPGILEQVRDVRKFQRNLSKWYWLFIGAIVVGLINIFLQFVSIQVPAPP